jgi:trigger factor
MTDENVKNPDTESPSPDPEPKEGAEKEKKEPEIHVSATAETTGEIERRLSVEVPWEDVHTSLDTAYVELGRGVTIKGFRRGKVPRRILEQLFGKHVVKEVAQRLVQESIPIALKQTGLVPASEPAVENPGIVPDQAFRYQMTFQILPVIEPKDYFDVEVRVRKAKVSDEEVEAALRMKQREHTAYKPVEGRPTQKGDVLLVDLMGRGAKGESPIDLTDRLIELGDPPTEPLPGLAAPLTGIAADTKELEIELDLPVPPAEGAPEGAPPDKRHVHLFVTIKDLKEKVVPELDDDFAKDTGEAETLGGLREVLRKKLLENDELRAKDEAKQALMKEVVTRNNVPVVPALVDRYLDGKVKLQKAMYGMDPDEASETDGLLKEHLRESTVDQVKAELVLDAIAKKESVEVLETDLEKRFSEIAKQRGQNTAKVRSEYEKEGRLEILRGRVREDKTLDLLMSKAKIIVEEIASEPPSASEADAKASAPAPGGEG